MEEKILLRAIGDNIEVYQFIESIKEFEEFYNANVDTFSIYEIANLEDVEISEIDEHYSVYDMTLAHSHEHFWLIKDKETGMYEPVDSQEQVDYISKQLKEHDNPDDSLSVEVLD